MSDETAAPPPDTAKYFLARLLGPRPDFVATLTPEERQVMLAHGKYWAGQMARGKVLVLGPVNDPKGNWGLGVMRVDSEEELLALQAEDPAILSGNGMYYENIPMFRAVWPGAGPG